MPVVVCLSDMTRALPSRVAALRGGVRGLPPRIVPAVLTPQGIPDFPVCGQSGPRFPIPGRIGNREFPPRFPAKSGIRLSRGNGNWGFPGLHGPHQGSEGATTVLPKQRAELSPGAPPGPPRTVLFRALSRSLPCNLNIPTWQRLGLAPMRKFAGTVTRISARLEAAGPGRCWTGGTASRCVAQRAPCYTPIGNRTACALHLSSNAACPLAKLPLRRPARPL